MTKLVLHIGAHKCGTTSIQEFLQNATDGVPGVSYFNRKLGEGITNAIIRYRNGKLDVTQAVDCILTAVNSENVHLVIASDENCMGPMPGVARDFYPRTRELRRLLEDLSKKIDLKVAIQAREPSDFLYSCWKFRVAHGLSSSFPEFYYNLNLDSISWKRISDDLIQGAGYETVLLEYAAMREEIASPRVKEFLEFILDRKMTSYKGLPRLNVSSDDFTVILQQHINGLYDDQEQARRVTRLVSDAVRGRLDKNPTDARKLAAQLRESARSRNIPISDEFFTAVSERIIRHQKLKRGMKLDIRTRFAEDYREFCDSLI